MTRRNTSHSKMAIEIRARAMASINACTIVAPHSMLPIASPVAVGSTASTACAKRRTVAVSLALPLGQTPNAHAPVLRNPIADQIDRQALAGYTFGHQALLNVIKIEPQRTNERIPGLAHAELHPRSRVFAWHQPSGARPLRRHPAGLQRLRARAHLVAALLRSRRFAWRGRGALCKSGSSSLFLHFQSTQVFFLDRRGRSCRSSQ